MCIRDRDDTKKSRMCIRGCEDQNRFLDRLDYAAISRQGIRMILQIAVEKQWRPCTVDVGNAFLQAGGDLMERKVYMTPPRVWPKEQGKIPRNSVLRLKSQYTA